MSKTNLYLHEKIRGAEGLVVEFKVWRVPKSDDFPEGFKYSFFAVKSGKVLVGYDPNKPKGHHRHIRDHEEPYTFQGVDRLREDFMKDLKRVLRDEEEGR